MNNMLIENDSNDSMSTDSNNNKPNTTNGYALRPRDSLRKSSQIEDLYPEQEQETWRLKRSRKSQKALPLSKYRRKTANARERSRMKEINDAFEALRRVIPQMSVAHCTGEKLTKISTLRLAMKYIEALNSILQDRFLDTDGEAGLDHCTVTSMEIFAPSIPSYQEATLANSSYVFDENHFLYEDFS